MADSGATHVDLNAIRRAARFATPQNHAAMPILAPPGQRIAIARDEAFSFTYAHLLSGWRDAGAEILPFPPLADEAPASEDEAVWLPGGYPELHSGPIAPAPPFLLDLPPPP